MSRIKKSLKQNLFSFGLYTWILSIVVFILLPQIFNSQSNNGIFTSFQSSIFFLDIFIGIISFIIMILAFTKSKLLSKKNTSGNKKILSNSFFTANKLLIGCIIILLLVVGYLYGRSNNLFLGTAGLNSPTPTIEELPTNTPIPNQETNTQIYYATPNPDPIIDCKFTYLGTIRLRSSVCRKSTDCQISGKWVYYDSVERCKADQAVLNKVPNTYIPSSNTYPSCAYYNSTTGSYATTNLLTPESCKTMQNLYTFPTIPTAQPTITPYQTVTKTEAEAKCKSQVDNGPVGSACEKGQDYSVCMMSYGFTVAFPYCFN